MDAIAQEYVRLTLAVGRHDPNYVDAYFGPPEWREGETLPLPEIRVRATAARAALEGAADADEMSILRRRFLAKQLDALIARVAFLGGERMTFDEESAALYDVVAPEQPDAVYAEAVAALGALLPGEGTVSERYERLRARFYVPPDRLAAVFEAAIDAARARTKRHIPLPEDESFEMEMVKGEVWGAYNWYQGGARSLIQVNTDFPTPVDRAVGLACHEGYPGHHVYNALLEGRLARERGWVEFTVYPLYSPESLIAEGTAEYGVELCFPEAERRAFERETLFPLAGLDPGGADEYAESQRLVERLAPSGVDAARRLLDGRATRAQTEAWLVEHALATPERAAHRIGFFEVNRSYIVTYGLGLDLVRRYVEAQAATETERWAVFTRLLSTPQVPSNLAP